VKASWKLGRLAGIDVHVHVTFLLLLGWVAISQFLVRRDWHDALGGLAFILSLFGIVVLHELGHALMARRFGIRTRDITLLPIGGVARLERIPEEPRQELLVALAGPAVNVVLAGLLFVVLQAAGGVTAPVDLQQGEAPFLTRLLWVNVSLALFNLLPAFPMDGGRVLRALLAMRMPHARATTIAAAIGKVLAGVLGFVGLFTNPFLLLIALFVWIGATQEAGQARMKSVLHGVSVGQVMVTEFRSVAAGDTLADAVAHVLAGCQEDFPVLEHGRPVGVLKRTDLLEGLARRGESARVGEVMQQAVSTARPGELVEEVLARLPDGDPCVLPVLDGGRLVGVFTAENLGEYLMIQAALGRADGPGPAQGAKEG
jgi:Zn-dependent protease/predicted transcriptional regulator